MINLMSFDDYNIVLTLLISFAIQIAFFVIAATLKTDKVTDLSYGLSFVKISVLLLIIGGSFYLYQIVIAALITAWGLRLAFYLFYRIFKMGRDKRFDGIRENPVKFAGFWLLQAVSIWIIMLPATIALSAGSQKGPDIFLIAGALIWLVGLFFETVADWQKFKFKSNPENSGQWIQSGLWKYSRHPNYFGEILCWIGIFILAIPALSGWLWLSVISPVYITFLLLFLSGIPTLEKKYDERYAGNEAYKQYKNQTSILIPIP